MNASLRSLPVAVFVMAGLCGACTGYVGDVGSKGSGSNTGSGGSGTASGGATGSGGGSVSGSGGNQAGSGGSGSGGSGAAGSGGSAPPPPLDVVLDGKPVNSRFVRLTNEQWENAVRDVLQLPAAPGLSATFEGAPPDGTFSNNERALFITSGLWDDYESAAETLSQQVTRDATALSKLTAGATTAAAFIPAFGRRAYRRDLTSAEVTRYTTLFTSGAAVFNSGNAFTDGVQLVVETMLKSPYFLYRVETANAGQALGGYEVAAKLSFLLRNTTPDTTLLDAAKAGSFGSPEQIGTQAQTMLDTATARAAFQRFHTELLGIERYRNIEKDATAFPSFNASMAADLQTADSRFFDYIFDQDLGFKDLLLSQVAFVNQTTAPLYGMTATGTAFTQVQLGSDRPGYFTRAGFLALNGTLRDPDPIRRGVDIIRRVMGNANFSPPDNVIIQPLPMAMPGQTNRERVDAHTGPGTCGASCHGSYINPIGFAFENLDALGQTRTMDAGKPVDTTGSFPFADGQKAFTGVPSLMQLLADDPHTQLTYAAHVAEFVLSRDIGEADRPYVQSLANMQAASIKQLALAIIKSDAFTKRGTP